VTRPTAPRGRRSRVQPRQSGSLFTAAEERVAATYSQGGRPACCVGVLLRLMILQHLYGLSDPQAEEQLKDRLSFQKFVQPDTHEAVPDGTGEKPIGTDAQGGGLQPQTAGGHPETAKRVENASRKKMKERTKTKNHDELADRKAIFTGASRRRRHLFSKTSPFADSSFGIKRTQRRPITIAAMTQLILVFDSQERLKVLLCSN
jgi:hypothetical protein